MWLTAFGVVTCASFVACLMPVELTDETFSSTVKEGKPVFVKFYAPWCGHCKRLAPTWDDLNSHYENTDVTIAKVDCTKFSSVCGDEQVRGYPTLKLFHDGGVVKYEGARDLKSFTDFVDDHISKSSDGADAKEDDVDINIDEMGVMHLNDGNFDIVTSKGVHFVKFYAPWCGHCQKLAPTWSDLAAYYNTHNKDIRIVKVDCTENTVTCPKYSVRSYPTLILLQDGEVKANYNGNRELDHLIEFVATTLNEQPKASVPQVKVLTGNDFDSTISAGTTFVKFYAPWCGHCKRLAPTWDQLAEITHSKTGITIAKVDCTVEKELCETHQVRGYPTLILFKDGSKKANYSGARDIESLLAFLEN